MTPISTTIRISTVTNDKLRLHKGRYLFPESYTDAECVHIHRAEALGWTWIDPRGGDAYQWRNPQGIYVLEGPPNDI